MLFTFLAATAAMSVYHPFIPVRNRPSNQGLPLRPAFEPRARASPTHGKQTKTCSVLSGFDSLNQTKPVGRDGSGGGWAGGRLGGGVSHEEHPQTCDRTSLKAFHVHLYCFRHFQISIISLPVSRKRRQSFSLSSNDYFSLSVFS